MDKPYSIEEIKQVVAKKASEYGVRKVMLFGSYARGEATEHSDIDLIVEKGEIKGLLKLCNFKNSIEDSLQITVDVVEREGLFEDLMLEEITLYEH